MLFVKFFIAAVQNKKYCTKYFVFIEKNTANYTYILDVIIIIGYMLYVFCIYVNLLLTNNLYYMPLYFKTALHIINIYFTGVMDMKKIIILLMLLLLPACAQNRTAYPTIQEKLTSMESYRTDAELTYISGKGETQYTASQIADKSGRYRIETSKPEEYTGNIVMYDGKMVWQYNPSLKDNKISVNPPDKAARREIILFSFLENYVKSKDVSLSVASLDESLCTVLEAQIPGDNKLLATEKLWVDNETQNPVRLVIYDSENKERIVAQFSNFEYNYPIDDNTFVLKQ